MHLRQGWETYPPVLKCRPWTLSRWAGMVLEVRSGSQVHSLSCLMENVRAFLENSTIGSRRQTRSDPDVGEHHEGGEEEAGMGSWASCRSMRQTALGRDHGEATSCFWRCSKPPHPPPPRVISLWSHQSAFIPNATPSWGVKQNSPVLRIREEWLGWVWEWR